MKLLALRLDDHDSNMSYFDGEQLHYIKTERIYQEKHHAYKNLHQWKHDIQRFFGVSPDELDEIVIITDQWQYGEMDDDDFQFMNYNHVIDAKCPVWRIEHHYAHALSAWMFPETKYQFVFDGFGEIFQEGDLHKATSWSVFEGNKLVERDYQMGRIENIDFGSLGVLYESAATMCGITADNPQDIAGKFMSFVSYGVHDEQFAHYMKQNARDIKDHFDFNLWVKHKQSDLVANHTKLNWAKTIQTVIGERLVELFSQFADKDDPILFTGGCAQNIYWNTVIKNHFPNLVVAPHSADEGLSLGGIEWLRRKNHLPEFDKTGYPYWQNDEHPVMYPSVSTIKKTANQLAQGKIVGWYQGLGEVGPRALGNRSILMRPDLENAKHLINSKVKHREYYRPFGATVLKEHQHEYFDLDFDSPHMLYLSKLKQDLPAISHVDGTCRHQTLGNENPTYRLLIEEFYKLTGLPVLLNTSLNRGGKPIAGKYEDAVGVLCETELDTLVHGHNIHTKGTL